MYAVIAIYNIVIIAIFSSCCDIYFVMNKNTFCFTVILQDYCFLPDGTLCDALKLIFFWSIICNDCKNTVFHMLGPSLMDQNRFSFELLYAMSARILFSACWNIVWLYAVIARVLFTSCWDILWWIKTHFVLKWWIQ